MGVGRHRARRRGRAPIRGMTRRRRGGWRSCGARSAGDLVCRADPLTAARVELSRQINRFLNGGGTNSRHSRDNVTGYILYRECKSAPALGLLLTPRF